MAETLDGIVTPDGDDNYALIQDLAAMAETIQQVINQRANARSGTQLERQEFSADAPEGTLWKDTNGERILWIKHGSSWERLWPEPVRRLLRIGSYEERARFPYINMRWLHQNGDTNAVTLQQRSGNHREMGAQLSNFMNGSLQSSITLRHDGGIFVTSGGTDRRIPYAYRSGRAAPSRGGTGRVMKASVSFPSGWFTEAPNMQLTVETSSPDIQYHATVSNVSRSGATIQVVPKDGTTIESVRVHWQATQHYPERAY